VVLFDHGIKENPPFDGLDLGVKNKENWTYDFIKDKGPLSLFKN